MSHSKTIAVIDDNPDNLLLLECILEEHYELVCYSCGLDALDGLGGSGADIILLDITLPDISGEDVCKRLRAQDQFKEMPILALTAHTGNKAKYEVLGFDDYVGKPILDEDIFLELIEQHLEATSAS